MTVLTADTGTSVIRDIVNDPSQEDIVFIIHHEGVIRMDLLNQTQEPIQNWSTTFMYDY